jgi:hypothetical protein
MRLACRPAHSHSIESLASPMMSHAGSYDSASVTWSPDGHQQLIYGGWARHLVDVASADSQLLPYLAWGTAIWVAAGLIRSEVPGLVVPTATMTMVSSTGVRPLIAEPDHCPVLAALLVLTTPVGTGQGVHGNELLHPVLPHVHLIHGQIMTEEQLAAARASAQLDGLTSQSAPGPALGGGSGAYGAAWAWQLAPLCRFCGRRSCSCLTHDSVIPK